MVRVVQAGAPLSVIGPEGVERERQDEMERRAMEAGADGHLDEVDEDEV